MTKVGQLDAKTSPETLGPSVYKRSCMCSGEGGGGTLWGGGGHSQFRGLFGQTFGQRAQALVAAADHRVQTGTLGRTAQHRGAAVLVVTWGDKRRHGVPQRSGGATQRDLLRLTLFAGKVLDSYILDGDLLQEVRALAARVPRDDAFPSQPITEPSQVTVTVEGIGQKVSGEEDEEEG